VSRERALHTLIDVVYGASPSVANGDDSSVQMETNAVAPQAAQSGNEADDNLSGIDDDSPSTFVTTTMRHAS
jgi:hypothetical protein